MRAVVPEAGDLGRGVSPTPERPVRVRIAPSPTGYFHVGSARTALYNLCVARQNGGVFIVRIEDTDRERHQEEQYQGILDALIWLGIDWDEGPYRQSERSGLYEATLDQLWETGNLYACECTREEVEARTKGATRPGYDGFCRGRRLERGPGRALRFAVPEEGVTVVHDLVRGDVEFANSDIEDFVVARSNGEALFVLAVVTDDRDMGISHVIRAEEHLPTTPKAILIWEALNAGAAASSAGAAASSAGAAASSAGAAASSAGAAASSAGAVMPLPAFAHLPLLVNERRQKISKRRGDRVAIEDYRAEGYLPEAIGNYLALLGWSFEDGRDFFTRSELIEAFRLEDVIHSPAFFDIKKLLHFNGVYLRQLTDAEFTERCRTWATETGSPLGTALFDTEEWSVLVPLVKERVGLLSEVPFNVEWLFAQEFTIEEASWAKAAVGDEAAMSILGAVRGGFEAVPVGGWEAPALKDVLNEVAAAHGRKLGKAQAPVRVATLGRSVGLPLFESLQVLGRGETLRRLTDGIERLAAHSLGDD
jgi:glutamyl-tRNA synthetase